MGTRDRRDFIIITLVSVVMLLVSYGPSLAAEPAAARHIGDYGNVTVMEFTGDYNNDQPGGPVESDPRTAIAKEFYRLHKDEHDFLVIFTNFDFRMPYADAIAFYTGIRNDTKGIGSPLFDYSSYFGSRGKLQGTIDMGNIANLSVNPLDSGYEETLDTISHEMMHRWAAHVRFRNPDGSLNSQLLGRHGSHWSFLLSTDASLMYGNTWQDNGDGTFTSVQARKYYSPLDLYLMGFIGKAEVPPMLLIENPDIDPTRSSEADITIPGIPRQITIDDIIAVEGDRFPGPVASQKSFKAAFILLTSPGSFTGDEIYGLESIRSGWITRYSILTDGAGLVQVEPSLIDVLPVNPGILPPSESPRALPSNMYDGVSWLINNQQADGSWLDSEETAGRDTSEAVLSLKKFEAAAQPYTLGLQWLSHDADISIDELARRAMALIDAGQDASSLINAILSLQNPDGSWGSSEGVSGSLTDTSLALRAVVESGYEADATLSKALEYLKLHQNPDGGWGGGGSGNVEVTTHLLVTFKRLSAKYQLGDSISPATSWLLQQQNPDGGFGSSPSTVYDTSNAVLALYEFDLPEDVRSRAVSYLMTRQSADGSWQESPFQTARAVKALYKATIDPDLSVKNTDMNFVPASVISLPSSVQLSAVVSNLGQTVIPDAVVALYDGAITPERRIAVRNIGLPGMSEVALSFDVEIRDGSEHRFYIVADPANLIRESNENNNAGVKILYPEASYDLMILPGDVSVLPNPQDIFRDLTISAKISNRGTMNAYSVPVRYVLEDGQSVFEIGEKTLDLPANAEIQDSITWRANRAGMDMQVRVYIDPYNHVAESDEQNNTASASVAVNGSAEPNLSISYKDISFSPLPMLEGKSAVISAVLKNTGFSAVADAAVSLYIGDPKAGGRLLETKTIPLLRAGESAALSFEWKKVDEAGSRIIYIKADPIGLISEIIKDDNDAFIIADILSLPDLAVSSNSISFNPQAPREGDSVAVRLEINNLGEQAVSGLTVTVHDGAELIESRLIESVAGNVRIDTTFSFDTKGKNGLHEIRVFVDPDGSIQESSKENNQAIKTLAIQNADLWLTEPYFSPNGDGTKDTTTLYYRLEEDGGIRVNVADHRGRIVKTFSSEGQVIGSTGGITWDGFNDQGMIVSDGRYEFQVIDGRNSKLGSIQVAVDNNRSSLTEAIGTRYLLNNNLTCMLPAIGYYRRDWQWLPDERGLLFFVRYEDPDSPEYTNGLYTMGPDGEDILRLIPADWQDITELRLSPDGEQVAFHRSRRDPNNNFILFSELWIVGADGRNLLMLDSRTYYDDYYEQSGTYHDSDSITWSPDSRHIAYVTESRGTAFTGDHPLELWILDLETMIPMRVDSADHFGNFSYYSRLLAWSPDSTKLAYSPHYECVYLPGTDYCSPELRLKVSDISGMTKDLAIYNDGILYQELFWLRNDQIVSDRNQELVLASVQSGDLRLISKAGILYPPSGGSLLFLENKGETEVLNLADENGVVTVLHERPIVEWGEGYDVLIGPVWSADGRKVAFVDNTFRKIDSCIYEPALIIFDLDTKTSRPFRIFEEELAYIDSYSSYCPNAGAYKTNRINALFAWLPDGESLLLMDDNGYFDFNTVTDAKGRGYLPIDPWTLNGISPLWRYLTYDQIPEPASACYGKGNSDISALRSLLNLTADLRAVKKKASVILKGIAADLNFEGYTLEYSDVTSPEVWSPVMPPSDIMIVNGIFANWVPPHEGVFYLKLTVRDRAGNSAVDRKRVSWGMSASIANLYKSTDIFSPNSDGLKDSVSIDYTVLEPVHLEFTITDSNGSIVKNINRDHITSGAGRIVWDGTDNAGIVVSDGSYTIRVLDYEFAVEVDSTFPEASIEAGQISGVFRRGELPPLHELREPYALTLSALAFDKNIKQWVIEYGRGNNPSEWYKYKEGSNSLGVLREDKFPNYLESVPAAELSTYVQKTAPDIFNISQYQIYDDIGYHSGDKFRITVEDTAGNRSSFTSDFIEEKVSLYEWDDHFIISGAIPGSLARPGIHYLGVFHTLRAPLVSALLQYSLTYNAASKVWNDWKDAVAMPLEHTAFLSWDNSAFGVSDRYAVRLRYIDAFGQEYYSGVVHTEDNLRIEVPCKSDLPDSVTVNVVNSIFEPLKSLKFQIQSATDKRYGSWTDIDVNSYAGVFNQTLHMFEQGSIPENEFTVYINNSVFRPGESYVVRVVGVTSNDITYEDTAKYPPMNCGLGVSLAIAYPEADCNQISGRAVINPGYSTDLDIIEESLNVYLDAPAGSEPLPPSAYSMNTTGLQEGSYNVRAELRYRYPSSPSVHTASHNDGLLVDRALPTSKINYPSKSTVICPLLVKDSYKDWSGIAVEGVADDANGVRQYRLFYGIGEDPSKWEPATTRKGREQLRITGKAKNGVLGIWDVTGMHEPRYSLKLEAIDAAGNKSCGFVTFELDTSVAFRYVSSDLSLVSPNGDGILDEVWTDYTIEEDVFVDVEVFRLYTDSENQPVFDSTAVRTIAKGISHSTGTGTVLWDGMNDSGLPVPDGLYAVKVTATDTCGNGGSRYVKVEVDNTPPAVEITYPRENDPTGNIIEVAGSANDTNFNWYLLEAASASSPDVWHQIASGSVPVINNGLLGAWNTSELGGDWTLRLSASDKAGNVSQTSVAINLLTRKTLIKNIAAQQRLISPNNDGRLESSAITFELTDSCGLNVQVLDSNGSLMKNSIQDYPAGIYSYLWDGRDGGGNLLPDGTYTVKFMASLLSNPGAAQSELITVSVDTSSPVIDIKIPVDGSFIRAESFMVIGSITDENIAAYSVGYSGQAGGYLIDSGKQNRSEYGFGLLEGLSEGSHILSITAEDLAANRVAKDIVFTIDRTPPKVSLLKPRKDEVYGNNRNIVYVTGSIAEENLEAYTLRYKAASDASGWNTLHTGNALPLSNSLYEWKTGKGDGIADGAYILSLSAADKAGMTGEVTTTVIIDNTSPEVMFTQPKDGDYIKSAFEIRGNAHDPNLDQYLLELSEGNCSIAFKWAVLARSAAAVRDAVIGRIRELPADGEYCLRLSAKDRVDQSSETKISILIDTLAPSAPVLAGLVENNTDIRLSWPANPESDAAGYNLYRDGKRINTLLIKDLQYVDSPALEAVYTYTLKALDHAGNESSASNELKVRLDRTGPEAAIRSPQTGARVGGLINIKGSAWSRDDFKEYRLFSGRGGVPGSWDLIRRSPLSESYGVLAQWDTQGQPENEVVSFRLEAEDLSGNISRTQVSVTIDNTPPSAPLLLSAVQSGSSVQVSWQANKEADFSGYLLFRDDQLVNAQGLTVGSLRPYLLQETTYSDKNLPDGKYRYYLLGVDQADNQSDQSNSIEVLIDTHPPHAVITQPADKAAFDKRMLIRAESADNDVASLQFQYKRALAVEWVNIGSPVLVQPLILDFDPMALSLSFGDYHFRAVATDIGGRTDLEPGYITLTYKDVTPPSGVKDLKATVKGENVILSWTAATDADLAGYNIYRRSGETRSRLNAGPLKETIYNDKGLADGDYVYEVTASDTAGNETAPAAASATIYAPAITQPYTPVGKPAIRLEGISIPNTSVEISADTGSGAESKGRASAGASGIFLFDLLLEPGLNMVAAQATDSAGNVSRVSDMVVLSYSPVPAAPSGLTALVMQRDVTLSWEPNTETNLAGYILYRDGTKLNPQVEVLPSAAEASLTLIGHEAEKAIDHDPATAWMSGYGYFGENHVWYEISLPGPELINRLEIKWLDAFHAGRNFDVQVWSGYAWITVAGIRENWSASTRISINPSYLTDRLRINIAETTDSSWYSYPAAISGVQVFRDELITGTSHTDYNLANGDYSYRLTAVNDHGLESPASGMAEAKVFVKDTTVSQRPRIIYPTMPGLPIGVALSTTDVAGIAEAGSAVTLYHDNHAVGVTEASVGEILRAYELEENSYALALSPDGRLLLYRTNNDLYLMDLTSGMSELISQSADVAGWSPTGETFAYFTYDQNWLSHIQIYDTRTGKSSALTNESEYDEYNPSWSSDGKLLAFSSNRGGNFDVWLRDMDTGELQQLTSGHEVYTSRLSPDGLSLAFFSAEELYVMDIRTGALTLADNQTDTYSLDWSLTGDAIVFISYRDANAGIFMFNPATQAVTPLSSPGTNWLYAPRWTSDGQVTYYLWDSVYSIWRIPAQAGSEPVLIMDNLQLNYFETIRSGALVYQDNRLLNLLYPEGYFSFSGVRLENNENRFTATSASASGSISEPADEISVIFDQSLQPDLEITADDIYLYPLVPLAGQSLDINLAVRNAVATPAEDVEVSIYLLDESGRIELQKTETVSIINGGDTEILSFRWETKAKIGRHGIVVAIDPLDKIAEATKENNYAAREFVVMETEGVMMNASVDHQKIGAHQPIALAVEIANSAEGLSGTLEVSLQDEAGNVMEVLLTDQMVLPYGYQNRPNIRWNSGTTFAGIYRLHIVLRNDTGIIAEKTVSFEIMPDISVVSSISADRSEYGPNQRVSLDVRVSNQGANYLIPDMLAIVRILAPDGTEAFRTERNMSGILPGADISFGAVWGTGLSAPGDYKASLDVYAGGKVVSSGQATIRLLKTEVITGNIRVLPSRVLQNGRTVIEYTALNSGNSPAVLVPIRVLIETPDTLVIQRQMDEVIDLAVNGAVTRALPFTAEGLEPGPYTVTLMDAYGPAAKTLDRAYFEVVDPGPFGPLSGSIAAKPDVLHQGIKEVFTVTIRNAGEIDLTDLNIEVLVSGTAGSTYRKALAAVAAIPAVTTWSGAFDLDTAALPPGAYRAELRVKHPLLSVPKQLSTALFEVKSGLEITKAMPDAKNLLLWINDGCSPSVDGGLIPSADSRCINIEQVLPALGMHTDKYFVVHAVADFGAELRNPFYTDIMVLGLSEALGRFLRQELQERVYSGTGLVSSILMNDRDEQQESSSPGAAGFASYGQGRDASTGSDIRRPAAVLYGTYGKGSTAFFPNDLCSMTFRDGSQGLSGLLGEALSYVHRPAASAEEAVVSGFVPVELRLKSLGGLFDLEISEAYPAELTLFDPKALAWISPGPWKQRLHLAPFETGGLRYYVLLPDKQGSYPLMSEILLSAADNAENILKTDFTVVSEDDLSGRASSLLLMLAADKNSSTPEFIGAAGLILRTKDRTVSGVYDVEENIHDILSAINLLLRSGQDVSQIRLAMDGLLRGWQTRYYFWPGK